MKSNNTRFIVTATMQALLGLIAMIYAVTGFAQASVSFSPSILNLEPGESSLVAIEVTGVGTPGLSAFQISLNTDPALVAVSDPNAGFTDQVAPFSPLGSDPLCTTVRGGGSCADPAWLLTSTGRTAVNAVATEDLTGGNTVIMTGTTGTAGSVEGSGAIVFIEVTALAAGATAVTVSESILADGSAVPSEVIHTRSNLTVNVGAIVDQDADGIADSMDNCVTVANASQLDTDNDFIGNACDPDVDNNCSVNFIDYIQYRDNFLMAGPANTDNNGDNVTNFLDIIVFSNYFLAVPGPSGLPNACDGTQPAG